MEGRVFLTRQFRGTFAMTWTETGELDLDTFVRLMEMKSDHLQQAKGG